VATVKHIPSNSEVTENNLGYCRLPICQPNSRAIERTQVRIPPAIVTSRMRE
jgi:hypothetical protein